MRIKIQPDKEKAAALRKMAETTLKRLNETKIDKYPSNTLNDYYDIIHKLMEAISLSNGMKFKGDGAHKELIDYASKEMRLDGIASEFLQQMREYRNRIAYEGFAIHKNYIVQNNHKIIGIIKRLSVQASDSQE